MTVSLKIRNAFVILRRASLVGLALSLLSGVVPRAVLSSTGVSRAETAEQQADLNATELRPGQPLSREIRGGDQHLYQISLKAGQFLYVVVDQQGIDVLARLFGPDGKPLYVVDSPNEARGPERIYLLPQVDGVFRLQVESELKGAKPGNYVMRIEELRAAQPQDRIRVRAKMLFQEAHQLWQQPTLATLRQAIEKYQEALPLWREIGDRQEEGVSLAGLGFVHSLLGEKELALKHYGQAEPLFKAAGDLSMEAQTIQNTATVHVAMGNNQKGLDEYQRALPLLRAVKLPRIEAAGLQNISALYFNLGEYQRSLEYCGQALTIQEELNDLAGAAHALTNIGRLYIALGQPREAIAPLNRALPLHRQVKSFRGEAYTLTNLAQVYQMTGELRKALEFYQQAVPLHRSAGDRVGEVYTLNHIGRASYDLGQRQEALAYFNQALPIAREVRDPRGEAAALAEIARVERDRGNLNEALAKIEEALNLVEKMRVNLLNQELRTAYLAATREHYEFCVDLLMQLHAREPEAGHAGEALRASERSRARSLLDLLIESRASIRQGAEPQLVARENALQQQVNDKATRLVQLKAIPRYAPQAAALEKELDALLAELQNVKTELRRQSPRYAALTQPEPVSVKEIQTELLDADTLLLQYALGNERSYLWVVTRDSFFGYQLPPRAEIEAAARQAYLELSSPPGASVQRDIIRRGRRGTAARASDALGRLSEMAVWPVAAQLERKRLVIVADGALQFIPFGALSGKQAGKGIRRPLILDHEVVSLPSASTLAAIRRNPVSRAAMTKTLALFADPVFDARDERLKPALAGAPRPPVPASRELMQALMTERLAERGAAQSRQDGQLEFPRLRFTRQEAERIAALAPANDKVIALDFKANREAVLSESLKHYRFVHFATHAYLDSERPELSALVLAQVDETGAPVEGFLRAHEIYNLDLPVDLVVLSACRTGLGKQIKGEGLVGLTQGFLYAGAPRVVVSLWSVNDAATAELMERFYRSMLKRKMTPASALRAAQIEMLRRPNRQSPYYWAAFLPLGDWR